MATDMATTLTLSVDATQWADTDGDGYGDNKYGSQGDHFPNDETRWKDSDEDGVADEDDAFANDPTQSEDRDGDGYGDNESGTNPDQFLTMVLNGKTVTTMA